MRLTKDAGRKSSFRPDTKPLAEEVEKLSLMSQMGWEVSLDIENRWYVFDMLTGRNLTADQDIRPPAIFSTDYDNIESQSYISSAIGHKNIAVVAGQGEGEDRKIVTVGTSTGLNRHEMFCGCQRRWDSRGGLRTSLRRTNQENAGGSGTRKTIRSKKETASLEAKILLKSNLTYRKDYDLGDVVTVLNRQWGLTMNTRITEAVEVYEPGGIRVDVIFGNEVFLHLRKQLDKN
ncbi:siphovirus ReqiPepy6 Gp37-like family protein [Paenibacillus larvae]|nr:siphovirus ReqiPepy6 Gp37-like family protein [Paenibacillus larvae]MDT2304987.1 siphovirus ReqiPepy6 Gp37-like family protein [Paenibacillus larvae]